MQLGEQRLLDLGAGGDRLGTADHRHRALHRAPRFRQPVHFVERYLRQKLLVQFVLGVDARHRLALHVVADILLHQPHRRPLIALQPHALHAAQQVRLLALQLGGGESVAQDALHLFQHRVEPALDAVLVDPRDGVQHRGVRHKQRLADPRPQERRVGHLGALEQPGVGHHREQRLGNQIPVGGYALTSRWRQLGVDAQYGGTQLRVGIDRHTRFVVRRNRILGTHRGRLGPCRPLLVRLALRRRCEVAADQFHHRLRIEVAHHGHRHQVGPVPALVEADQVVPGGRLDHLRHADREPHGILRLAEQHGKLQVPDARRRAAPRAPLFQHHAALLFHLLRVEGDGEGPVAEDLERGFDYVRVVGWYLDLVDGFIERGVCIQVGAELGADRLQVLDDLVARKALGAVERHVLDVVRETAFVLFLQDRAGAYRQPELRAVERFAVFLDVPGEAVAERAVVRLRVERELPLRRLSPGRRRDDEQDQEGGSRDRVRSDPRAC